MKRKGSALIGMLVGVLLLPLTSAHGYFFYIDSFEVDRTAQTYAAPYVDVEYHYLNPDTAQITLTSETHNGYTYAFGDVGINTNGTVTVNKVTPYLSQVTPPQYDVQRRTNNGYQMDGYGRYSVSLETAGTDGAGCSITEMILLVSGLGGQSLFTDSDQPLAVHLFAWDGSSAPAATGFAGPSPVPIPAAAWLFGSGVPALFGIRRRLSKGSM